MYSPRQRKPTRAWAEKVSEHLSFELNCDPYEHLVLTNPVVPENLKYKITINYSR
jgi:hypothetical protein